MYIKRHILKRLFQKAIGHQLKNGLITLARDNDNGYIHSFRVWYEFEYELTAQDENMICKAVMEAAVNAFDDLRKIKEQHANRPKLVIVDENERP